MKTFKDLTTGEIYTEDELRKAFNQFKYEMIDSDGNTRYRHFEDYLEEKLALGRNIGDGLIEL